MYSLRASSLKGTVEVRPQKAIFKQKNKPKPIQSLKNT
ncbi:hypothetical protein BN424_3544 [Carnobacterium maltaromaticum LMA28]|uniref:Uncharacterized protein n=1 Tax=Carnobacterium maltaromaticum LMA28 TaxID=1234679 RepID=K8E820_CARML|nr:hypothetical protein BN424_3544 [Carnobacterium maltaromaticum LMA28]